MNSCISDTPALPLGSSEPFDDHLGADPLRVLSRADSEALFHRIVGLTTGGGDTSVSVRLAWVSGLRWARNHPTTSQITRGCRVVIQRVIGGVRVQTETNKLDDASLKAVLAAAEQRLKETPRNARRIPDVLPPAQQYVNAPIWSDTTFKVTKQIGSDVAQAGVELVRDAKMFAAGYLETRVATWAIFNTKGLAAYAAGTSAHYSETVRNAEGTGSGWAGVMQNDWSKLDAARLSTRALQKCVTSADPRAIEPGRYTVILEPQAVAKFMFFAVAALDSRIEAENGFGPYAGTQRGESKIGQRVLDERITISTDPMDPDCPYIPFDGDGYPYRPVTWIEKGVLKELSYNNQLAQRYSGTDLPLLNPNTFRMSGGDTSIEEMIATTERGVLVTNLGPAHPEDPQSVLVSTYTRDGIWLIERGKIKFPVKNMRVMESPLFVGNTVQQLGKPERVFGVSWVTNGLGNLDDFTPEALGNIPIVVPPMKVQDFNFASLSDAV